MGEDDGRVDADEVAVEELRYHLAELEETVDDPAERREVRDALDLVDALPSLGVREQIRKFTRRDVAESFVGSTLVSLPLLVEDGVFDIAAFFLERPTLFLVDAVSIVLLVVVLLYVADFREVHVNRPILGVVPRRLVSVLLVAFVSAAFTMTLWGRVGGWTDPLVALSRIFVVWNVAAFGAGLSDILPGESEGEDINDELDDLGERIGIGDEEGRF